MYLRFYGGRLPKVTDVATEIVGTSIFFFRLLKHDSSLSALELCILMKPSSPETEAALREALLRWYGQAARKLPWRGTRDPYAIFLSEIILQQTRVAQGTPYYLRFMETYPTVQELAAAPDDDVMRLWQGLGYYSRARNMLKAARQVAAEGWPPNAAGLAKLPGIGAYTSAAIASIAFGEAVPVVDGNVARVLSRWFDMDGDILKPATQARMRTLAGQLMGDADPARFNQAMMEFGALFCVPGNPPCLACPMRDLCQAFAEGTVPLRPVKAKAGAKRERYLTYLALRDAEGRLLVHRREGKGIWHGLYEFFCLEGDGGFPTLAAAVDQIPGWAAGEAPESGKALIWTGRHILSHQILHIQVWEEAVPHLVETGGYRAVSLAEWESLGKPVPMIKATEALS